MLGRDRIVAWLKVVLPLSSLVLLSTLFLLSRPASTPDDIPFADPDLALRAARGEISAPNFAGMSEAGDSLTLRAEVVRPDPSQEEVLQAEGVVLEIEGPGGSIVSANARRASLDGQLETVELTGNVRIETSSQYSLTTNGLRASLEGTTAESLGPVAGNGPPGRFIAGRMVYETSEGGDTIVVFTDGIDLLYDPRPEE